MYVEREGGGREGGKERERETGKKRETRGQREREREGTESERVLNVQVIMSSSFDPDKCLFCTNLLLVRRHGIVDVSEDFLTLLSHATEVTAVFCDTCQVCILIQMYCTLATCGNAGETPECGGETDGDLHTQSG